MSKHKLSLWSAVLININVMVGAGIFINTLSLTKISGFFGFAGYLLITLLMLPLILVIAALLHRYPSGGFYTYGLHDISDFAGFMSAYGYFTGKLASVSLLIHIFSSLIQTLVPPLEWISVYVIDLIIILLFVWLNTLHMQTNKRIMRVFFVMKLFPLLFAIACCLYLFNGWSIPTESLMWFNLPATIPLVLFAFAGFEVCCALSSSIENAKVNAPRSIFISFAFVVALTVIYQLLFFLAAGTQLMQQETFLGIWPALLSVLAPHNILLQNIVYLFVYSALCCTALGSAYAILFSNYWNLYTIAKHDHVFFKDKLIALNKHKTPIGCVIVEGILVAAYLVICKAQVIPMQQIGVLGLTIAYLISSIGVLNAYKDGKNIGVHPLIALFSLGSCSIFVATIIINFIHYGLTPLLIFGIILLFGIYMFKKTSVIPQEASLDV